ncbi:ankyrin repeat domain-containing protein [Nocardia sp. NPDC056064]|uniref:ankyrin repeat domain-containing protein n=1 Tax=Nocardia sp. NPDC056064 TaxID=3345701 RepID=UPI0035E147F4
MQLTWEGTGRRSMLAEEEGERRDRLADAARAGEWDAVFGLIASGGRVNLSRLGGWSRFAPLHQAAYQGASESIVKRLLAFGAWRTLRTTDGETAAEIAAARGHDHLAALLEPELLREVSASTLAQLECQLRALIFSRAYDLCVESRFRTPPVGPVLEYPKAVLWCPIPGMYGGFSITLDPEITDALLVESWCRVVGGSGQRHRVRADGFELVEKGFV